MRRGNNVNGLPKKKITVTVDEKLVEWADQLRDEKVEFVSRSHVVDVALDRLKKSLELE